jgi:hypothetical protein
MKRTLLPVALAALLAPAPLPAETVEVAFDAALTNTTGWAYSDKILLSSDGSEHIYFRSIDSYVKSQQFSFNVTSITIRLSCSSANATRHLQIGPTSDIGQQTADVAEKGKQESQTFRFDAASNMRSFLISLKGSGGTGYWHVYSAAISGVPIVPPPTGLRADGIRGNRFTLSWTNPAAAVSNRIDVMRVLESDDADAAFEYDFHEFSNTKNSSVDITDSFTNTIPAFSGSSGIRLPAGVNGTIQISKDTERGFLVHSGLAGDADMSLFISLRIPTAEHGKAFGISYLDTNGSTNQFQQIQMGTEFKTNVVSLASVPPDAPLIFNTDGTGNAKRVVYTDYIAFIGATAAKVTTNVIDSVFAARSPATVRGLSPGTEYLVSVSAFDAEGNGSKPSDPIAVTTGDEGVPLSVRIR